MTTKKIMVRKDLPKVEVIEISLNVFQACNEFRLGGTTRMHVLKKFKGQQRTKSDWALIFKGERVI